MPAPKWTTSRILYEETSLGGDKRFKASRTDEHGVPHVGFGDTRPHAKADLRENEVADEARHVFHIQTTQPQYAAE